MRILLGQGLAVWGLTAVLVCVGRAEDAAEETGTVLIANGNMEKGNPPAGWKFSGVTAIADADCHSGEQSMKIVGRVHSGSAYSDYIRVKPNTRYRMELWYKGSEWFGDAYVFVKVGDNAKPIVKRFREDRWTRWTREFDTGSARRIHMGFYVHWSDHVLIDDVSLKEVGPSTAKAVPADVETPIDAAQAEERSWQRPRHSGKRRCGPGGSPSQGANTSAGTRVRGRSSGKRTCRRLPSTSVGRSV